MMCDPSEEGDSTKQSASKPGAKTPRSKSVGKKKVDKAVVTEQSECRVMIRYTSLSEEKQSDTVSGLWVLGLSDGHGCLTRRDVLGTGQATMFHLRLQGSAELEEEHAGSCEYREFPARNRRWWSGRWLNSSNLLVFRPQLCNRVSTFGGTCHWASASLA
jgi:hypothetical protein